MTNVDNTAAYEAIRAALAGRPLIVIDRFTSAGRTWLRDPSTGNGLSPDLAVGLYDSWPQAGQHPVLALERLTRRRDNRAKHTWLDLLAPVVSHELSGLPARDPVLHCWYTTPALKQLARTGSTILARPTDVRFALEDKTAFPRLMHDAGLPTDLWVNSVVLGHGGVAEGFGELQRRLDADTLVVQAAHGSGGRGTAFVRTAAEFEQATIYGPVRVAPYVSGASSNLSVLTVPHPWRAGECSVYVDAPSLKGIAVADLGIGPAKSAGNDWSKPWPADQLTRLISGIEQFARWAYRVHRLTGLWGVDVIWSPDGPVINEINCRLQGTTETASAVQRLRGHVPLVLAHLALQLGGSPTWLPTAERFNTGTIDWTATRRKAPFYVKLRATHPSSGTPSFPGSGVYHLGRHNELAWLRPGTTPLNADFDRGEVLIANAAPPGTLCTPGAELATVEGITSQPVFTPDGTGLCATMATMITTIRTAINRS